MDCLFCNKLPKYKRFSLVNFFIVLLKLCIINIYISIYIYICYGNVDRNRQYVTCLYFIYYTNIYKNRQISYFLSVVLSK